MPDVLLSNDDVTVLGPPSSVTVQLDVGATGTRGSQVFVGTGNPNSITIGQTPVLNDLFINNATGEEYSYMYQYVSRPAGPTWTPILKVNPTLYSLTETTTYTAGLADITIPIANILDSTGATISASNFSIQFSLGNDKISVATITGVEITGAGLDQVKISFKGMEYDGEWISLVGQVTTHLFITIVI